LDQQLVLEPLVLLGCLLLEPTLGPIRSLSMPMHNLNRKPSNRSKLAS
jgi:hypothetical protein